LLMVGSHLDSTTPIHQEIGTRIKLPRWPLYLNLSHCYNLFQPLCQKRENVNF
jgi:hypothetical protein